MCHKGEKKIEDVYPILMFLFFWQTASQPGHQPPLCDMAMKFDVRSNIAGPARMKIRGPSIIAVCFYIVPLENSVRLFGVLAMKRGKISARML